MRKSILLAFVSLFTINVKAQVWCPQGAQWYYNNYYSYSAGGPAGYCKLNYTNTVTISGNVCQQLLMEQKYMYQFNYSIITATSNIYTHVNNNVVYLYNTANNNFDTLYNYNGTIGDKWSLTPSNYTTCAKSRVTVVDTGHKLIQSVNLRWMKVNITGYMSSSTNTLSATDTIFERFGSVNNLFINPFNLCPWAIDGFSPNNLRCYSDNQIINYTRTSIACNYYFTVTSINKFNSNEEGLKIYPNPTNGILNISSTSSATKIEVINILGELVKEEDLDRKQSTDISDLPNGIYFLKVFDKNKLIGKTKIVKE